MRNHEQISYTKNICLLSLLSITEKMAPVSKESKNHDQIMFKTLWSCKYMKVAQQRVIVSQWCSIIRWQSHVFDPLWGPNYSDAVQVLPILNLAVKTEKQQTMEVYVRGVILSTTFPLNLCIIPGKRITSFFSVGRLKNIFFGIKIISRIVYLTKMETLHFKLIWSRF